MDPRDFLPPDLHDLRDHVLGWERLIDELPAGVVLLDRHGRVLLYNRYEERLARRRREDVLGHDFFHEVAICTDTPEIGGAFRAHIDDDAVDLACDFRFRLPFLPRPRPVHITLRSFRLADQPVAFFLVQDRLGIDDPPATDRVLLHDLRNDLSGVLGYASMLSQGLYGQLPPAQREAVELIEFAGRRLHDRLQASLQASHGVATTPARAPVNLHALLLSALALARPSALRRGLELHYEGHDQRPFPERAAPTLGHVDDLGAMIDNLVLNALKYARQRVIVALQRRDDRWDLEVRDDGPGIPPAQRAQILREGAQGQDAAPGFGLGLASVHHIVAAHDGQLTIDDAPEGGARFTVTLPASDG